MLTTTLPGLIRLGSARRRTRAVDTGEKMELNPIFHYDDAGAGADVIHLGRASRETRADDQGQTLELIPVGRWDPPGAR